MLLFYNKNTLHFGICFCFNLFYWFNFPRQPVFTPKTTSLHSKDIQSLFQIHTINYSFQTPVFIPSTTYQFIPRQPITYSFQDNLSVFIPKVTYWSIHSTDSLLVYSFQEPKPLLSAPGSCWDTHHLWQLWCVGGGGHLQAALFKVPCSGSGFPRTVSPLKELEAD